MSSAEAVSQTLNSGSIELLEHVPYESDEMILRKRRGWENIINPEFEMPVVDSDDDELEEEDEAGCPLPSTPEDTQLIEAEVSVFILYLLLFTFLLIRAAQSQLC